MQRETNLNHSILAIDDIKNGISKMMESCDEKDDELPASLDDDLRNETQEVRKTYLSSWREAALLRSLKNGCTAEFLGNISIVILSLLLVQLICRENGFTSDELEPFMNLSQLWVLSLVGGYVAKIIHLPPLLGMLTAGILTSNFTESMKIPEKWRAVFTSAGLAVILLRSGLELDFGSVKKSTFLTLRLTCIPGCVEAAVCGVSAMLLFDMPFWLGLSLGFILAAVSPAVVVTGMLNLQSLGYGVEKAIPSLVCAAASFDDVFAIGGFSICIGLAIQGEHQSVLNSVLHGPISVVVGILIGLGSGMILSITKVWDTTWKKSILAVLTSLSLMFGMKAISYPGGGAMGSITLGIVCSYCWVNGYPSIAASKAGPYIVQNVEHQISVVWDLMFEPLLFGCIGSALNFSLIPSGTLAKSTGIVCLGSCFRFCSAYLATGGGNLSTKERMFIALAWLPKATVQAALCSFPLLLVKDTFSIQDESYIKYTEWTEQILSTAILSICITAPLGVISIKFLGKRWLQKDGTTTDGDTNGSGFENCNQSGIP